MNDIERIERATQTGEYRMYSAMAGAALAGALFAPTAARRDEALRQYGELLKKQAALVRGDPTS